jgi:hypothetical protein
MKAKRPGAKGNKGETTHGANGIRGETTRIRYIQYYYQRVWLPGH